MVASFSDDVAHLSPSPAGDSPSGQLAKRRTPSLRNANVPKANSLPYINLVAEGESLKVHCAAVLHGDHHWLKRTYLFVRQVKSAEDDPRQALRRCVPEATARAPGDFVHAEELSSPTTASNVVIFNSLDSLFSPASSVLADEQDEGKDHVHQLLAVARSWLDFRRQLFSRRRALSDQTVVEEAIRGFCQAPIRSLVRSPAGSPLPQVHQSSRQIHQPPSPMPHSLLSSPGYSQAPSATSSSINQQAVELMASELLSHPSLPTRSCNASSTSLSGPRKLNRGNIVTNRALSDSLVPTTVFIFIALAFLGYASHSTLEDEAEENDNPLSVTPPSSPVSAATLVVDTVTTPVSPAKLSLSSQMDEDGAEPGVDGIEYDTNTKSSYAEKHGEWVTQLRGLVQACKETCPLDSQHRCV
ncbi:hypothetical protein JVT61DRAFT_8763 [Boletus reticuloceps]|uniref:Uncharacterized protein n=1 Tax=Boletus reticuloceps TaxID=495285 RepID=A0A8I2YHF7_9AGAM|nr:hypothetical protein JVT61DRAFT_8763 [Boletus reticuloceps]